MGICERIRLASVIGTTLLMVACGGDDGPGTAAVNPPAESPNDGAPAGGGAAPDDSSSVKNSPPTIQGAPAQMVLYDSPYAFQPEAEDADGDILHFSVANAPPWARFEPATGRLEGTPGSADIGTYEDIVITVSDGADDAALTAFAITVGTVAGGAVELSWVAPTENEDGSPLTDLAGYRIYWGTESGEYTNSLTIDNPGVVTYVLENLVPDTYYFAATAVNADGEESDYSEEASSTVS